LAIYVTCPPVPQAASPCPSAIGCAQANAGRAWLAGELAWQAGLCPKKENYYTIKFFLTGK